MSRNILSFFFFKIAEINLVFTFQSGFLFSEIFCRLSFFKNLEIFFQFVFFKILEILFLIFGVTPDFYTHKYFSLFFSKLMK